MLLPTWEMRVRRLITEAAAAARGFNDHIAILQAAHVIKLLPKAHTVLNSFSSLFVIKGRKDNQGNLLPPPLSPAVFGCTFSNKFAKNGRSLSPQLTSCGVARRTTTLPVLGTEMRREITAQANQISPQDH